MKWREEKKKRLYACVCARENDVDRMNENSGGGVRWSMSLLLFFFSFLSLIWVEPHIGSFLSVDIFKDCSSPPEQIRIFFMKILRFFIGFFCSILNKTFFYRMISNSRRIQSVNIDKIEMQCDEQDEISCIVVKFKWIRSRF